MKLLVFHIGQDRYGVPLHAVRRVLPLMELKRLPLAPRAVAGIMNLHGQPVPVIDLSQLAGLGPSAARFDTRIVVVDYRAPDSAKDAASDGPAHALGLMAERVLGVQEIDAAHLADAGVRAAAFLGPVAGHAGDGAGLVQLIELNRLLPPDLRAALFQPSQPEAPAL